MQADENFWKKCEGERIANAYELEQLLGYGGFGGVFRAVQIANGERLNKRVAIKLMLSGTIQQSELNFALELESHPNLVPHLGGNNAEICGFSMFYLVMELADRSLADFVKQRGGQISSSEMKTIVRDIAQGLEFLHKLDSEKKRYVHRDLKLLNVLQVGNVWKIADFGLAKSLEQGTMQASKIAGTPYYMPPELLGESDVSTKWDVWSLGVMIVEMLTGHLPFEGKNQHELECKIQRGNSNLQDVPREWLDIVKGCLTKDYERRWTATDILKALDSMVESVPQNQPSTDTSSQTSSQKTKIAHVRSSRAKGALSMTISIGLISGVGFMIWQLVKPVNTPPVITSPSSSPSPKETVSSKTAEEFLSDGLLKANSKDYKGAIADYNEAIRLKPDYDFAYVNRGNAKYGLGDKQGSIADYNEAIRLNPNYALAFNNRGDAKNNLGDKQGAITDYTKAIKTNQNWGTRSLANAYNSRGNAKYGLEDYQGAIADYKEAIRLNPNYALAYANRGLAKSELADKQGAIIDYNEAIRINPNNADPYLNRGSAKYALGDKQGAITDYNEAIRLNPDLAIAYNNRGFTKNNLGDKQGAITDYNEAIRLKPDYSLAYTNRGIAKRTSGDKQGAIADHTKAIEINQNWENSNLGNAYYSRGIAKYDLGNKQGAITDYNEAIRLKPDFSLAYTNLGLAKYDLGDKEGAITNYTKAIRLKPDSAEAYYNLGLVKYDLGDKQEALAAFRKASELYQQQGNTEQYNNSLDRIRELGG
jgi:tetratricopeptide (TPR) repeat protein